jgi:hypothetical protein
MASTYHIAASRASLRSIVSFQTSSKTQVGPNGVATQETAATTVYAVQVDWGAPAEHLRAAGVTINVANEINGVQRSAQGFFHPAF